MEKTCPHCKETFTPKRVDSVYCSRSCRQMAYIDRKTKTEGLSLNSIQKKDSGLTDDSKLNLIDPIDVSLEIQKPSIDVSEEKYAPHRSRFLDTLIEFMNERHQQSLLQICLDHEDLPSYSISLHLRCLVECLLIFSELKYLKVDDLMEVCNAFTHLTRSKRYAVLPDEYPYTNDIQVLREKLRSVCVKAKNADQIKFRLNQEDKIELIAMRFELAKYIPKRQFADLDFENA